MLKLYSGDLSPYSARVRLQIYAKGIGDIVLERPATFGTPEFRKAFPIGRIPVLDLGAGDTIAESEVIAEYLEEIYPEPSMLGVTPRETAHIRTIARIGDIYLMNNMFMLSAQSRAKARNQGIVDLLGGQVVRNIKALDKLIGPQAGKDGFACCGRLTMADCALVPGLFLVENVLPATGMENPIPAAANVAAYWAAIQTNEHAAKVLAELHRGLEERRELIRSGAFEKMMAKAAAAMAAAEDA
ncbi:glutathione S-transferase family protein [Phenylobacterium sp.]|uniref:glutathione S-transferase family protein n=1 Tax=Phenylobacterium sp. TaxID=1871053 RepID=UPI002BB520F0|nr:glutathione S-transferase family protein [Phenylobacterium sp.]HLZ73876.1 glutathione S-transferase family protein [Phenylobacterium sp.]